MQLPVLPPDVVQAVAETQRGLVMLHSTHVVLVAHADVVVHFCPMAFTPVSAASETTQLIQFISMEFKSQFATSKLSKLPVAAPALAALSVPSSAGPEIASFVLSAEKRKS